MIGNDSKLLCFLFTLSSRTGTGKQMNKVPTILEAQNSSFPCKKSDFAGQGFSHIRFSFYRLRDRVTAFPGTPGPEPVCLPSSASLTADSCLYLDLLGHLTIVFP